MGEQRHDFIRNSFGRNGVDDQRDRRPVIRLLPPRLERDQGRHRIRTGEERAVDRVTLDRPLGDKPADADLRADVQSHDEGSRTTEHLRVPGSRLGHGPTACRHDDTVSGQRAR